MMNSAWFGCKIFQLYLFFKYLVYHKINCLSTYLVYASTYLAFIPRTIYCALAYRETTPHTAGKKEQLALSHTFTHSHKRDIYRIRRRLITHAHASLTACYRKKRFFSVPAARWKPFEFCARARSLARFRGRKRMTRENGAAATRVYIAGALCLLSLSFLRLYTYRYSRSGGGVYLQRLLTRAAAPRRWCGRLKVLWSKVKRDRGGGLDRRGRAKYLRCRRLRVRRG